MSSLSEKMREYSEKVNASFKAQLEGDVQTSEALFKEVKLLWEELISEEFQEE